jgi:hypothetical protein
VAVAAVEAAAVDSPRVAVVLAVVVDLERLEQGREEVADPVAGIECRRPERAVEVLRGVTLVRRIRRCRLCPGPDRVEWPRTGWPEADATERLALLLGRREQRQDL